jgi:hypothetical protein
MSSALLRLSGKKALVNSPEQASALGVGIKRMQY